MLVICAILSIGGSVSSCTPCCGLNSIVVTMLLVGECQSKRGNWIYFWKAVIIFWCNKGLKMIEGQMRDESSTPLFILIFFQRWVGLQPLDKDGGGGHHGGQRQGRGGGHRHHHRQHIVVIGVSNNNYHLHHFRWGSSRWTTCCTMETKRSRIPWRLFPALNIIRFSQPMSFQMRIKQAQRRTWHDSIYIDDE